MRHEDTGTVKDLVLYRIERAKCDFSSTCFKW